MGCLILPQGLLAARASFLLNTILKPRICKVMTRTPHDQQRRLRGLQFNIDGQCQLAKNNLDSGIRMVNMMRKSFYRVRSEMTKFREKGEPCPERMAVENNPSGGLSML